MKDFFNNKKILIVVAHPDDELLGVGGTINFIKSKFECIIKVIILGEGITSRDNERNPELRKSDLKTHKKNILSAKNFLGYDLLSTYNFPDNRFDTIPLLEIIKIVENEKMNFVPDIIFTHHQGDLNIDHQITFKAVLTSFRPTENENASTLICFETPSSTEWQSPINNNFRPNFFIELENVNIDAKIKAMECYEFEKRKFPHPRSPIALKNIAINRGFISGVFLAEAFEIIRHVFKNENNRK